MSVDRKQFSSDVDLATPRDAPHDDEKLTVEWLTAVLNAMTDEVYFTDVSQRYTYANPAALREFGHDHIAGVRVEELVGKLQVLRPDGSPRPLEEAPPLRALRGEVISQEEHVVRTPRTGELRHRHVNASPVRNAGGEIIGSVSVVRDVTEAKRSREALAADLRDTTLLRDLATRRTHEGDTRQLFEDILDAAIAMMRAQAGTIQLLDERTRELTLAATRGFPAAMTSYFARVDASSDSPCGRALASRERVFMRFDVAPDQDPSGEMRMHAELGLLSAQSTPLVSRSGRLLGMFSTHWCTDRRLEDRELHFLDLLARQAADLIERVQKEDALREADRRKDEFIAVLAHELRNPLVPIRTGIELLKSAAARPDLIETVRPMMERQMTHMVRLIDDLLDVARIAAGKFELKRERVALSSVVGNAVDAQRRAIETGGHALRVDLPHPEVYLHADATRLSQVISNLLHNSVKFTPPGGSISIIGKRQAGAEADTLMLRVLDTGRGIDAAQLPGIFDSFSRSEARTQSHEGGLGLGLSIARKLLEMHGGRIEARSEGPGKGCEFQITLPLDEDSSAQPTQSPESTSSLHDLRVLVVDDNHDAADSMAMLVEFAGAKTHTAYSASEAIDLIPKFRPRAILLDIGMPVMDGYTACRRIRATHGDDIAIIAVSGWGQDADKQRALSAGFDAHLTKPADPTELTELLVRLGAKLPRA
ncbi:MAG: domain S-box protein [Steroidobacteraceae bacterium]|nr:domain S-box protein [Steroidobacteraceae bacterium]